MDETKTTPAVAIASVGCRTNQEEMTALSASLLQRGYRLVENPAEASIIIVNTCSVTAATESKTRRLLRSLAAQAPHSRMLVTGCLAQQRPDDLLKMDRVCWVVGNGCKDRIEDIIQRHAPGSYMAEFKKPSEPLAVNRAIPLLRGGASPMSRTRYSVKVQEGCDLRCSFCIVPLLRGPSRSASIGMIVDACRSAVEAGYKEIVLTGTHIGQFNDRGSRLVDLLDTISGIEGDFRIRLSSLDPRDCNEELLGFIERSEKICDHLHVSLQSCSEQVLKAMNRSVAETFACVERLEALRKKFPLFGLGADLIAGFPGETEAMFEETCRRIQSIGLSYAHVFRFSPRPGTEAAKFPNQVKEIVKTRRSQHLMHIVALSRARFLDLLKNSTQRIIVESGPPVHGLTSNYVHIEIPDCSLEHNTWQDVIVTGPLRGRYCSAQPLFCKVA